MARQRLHRPSRTLLALVAGTLIVTALPVASDQTAPPRAAESELRDLVARYELDRAALARRYALVHSPARMARQKAFYDEWAKAADAIAFEPLGVEGRIDHVLLRNQIAYERQLLLRHEQTLTATAPLLTFAKAITDLHDARLEQRPIDPAAAARILDSLADELQRLGQSVVTPVTATRIVAFRAREIAGDLESALGDWYRFYAGYDPQFTWWAAAPYKRAAQALTLYKTTLLEKVVGVKPGDEEPIVGNPIGRPAIVADLGFELIPYGPEELLVIAQREFAWCEAEMRRAARDMGLGDDWKSALERVKTQHVAPGKQADLITELAREAEAYVQAHDLVTVPPLAKEIWRVQMMTPERQLINPFFTGGEVISVSYPTDAMSHDDKLMSMRGNNRPFARATVFHELIPGHHLQQFMNVRHNSHRLVFATPFWREGWSLYWEMLLWDLGFTSTPEDRVGALFWRMHRAARIMFSLRFHLGEWTPQECIDFLVDRAGHERANATAEVRRSFNGSYPPLYQLAYMIGGLQFRALHAELVGAGTVTNRDFHDAILTGGIMPVEMVRARLLRRPPARDHRASWKF